MTTKSNQTPTVNSIVTTIQIIHIALCLGILAILTFGFISNNSFSFETTDTTNIGLGLILLFGGIFLGSLLYKKNITSIASDAPLQQKFTTFQTASIIRYSLLEGAALFMGVQFLNSGNLLYATIAFVALCVMIFFRPTKDKIKVDLKLSGEQLQKFNKGEVSFIK